MAEVGNQLGVKHIIAVILGIVGLVWLIWSLWKNWKANSIKSWPRTDAIVTSSVAVPTNGSDQNQTDPRYINATNNNTQYSPKITYRYRVAGKEYTSNNIMYTGPNSFNATDIKALMAPLYPGAIVPIYYNQGNAAESYVYTSPMEWTGVIGGIILLILAGLLGLYRKSTPSAVIAKSNNRYVTNAVIPPGTTTYRPTSFRRNMY